MANRFITDVLQIIVWYTSSISAKYKGVGYELGYQ